MINEFLKHECNCEGKCDVCTCEEERKATVGARVPNDNEVFWARDNDTVLIPTKRDEDGGFDVYANFEEDYIVIPRHTTVMIPTGLHSAFSSKWVAILKERGSNGSKGIAQRCGVLDSGFRNEWKIPLTNTNNCDVIIAKKHVVDHIKETYSTSYEDDVIIYPYEKAVCQAIFVEVPKLEHHEISVDELLNIPSERGMGMLGSSGK